MGLDSVELVMAIEEEFGIEIEDSVAEKMVTVGDVYKYLSKHLSSTPPQQCLTQMVFYRLRRALIATYGLKRNQIRPESKLTQFLSEEEIEEGWPWMDIYLQMNTPYFKVERQSFPFFRSSEVRTIKELVRSLIEINLRQLPPERVGDDAEIWTRLVAVFMRQLNVYAHEVVPEARITADLGCD